MTAYIIARVAVTDPDHYATYSAQTPGLVARYGGRFLVRGGTVTTEEGPPEDRRIVVLEFADRAAAERFYHSADYQAVIGIRHAAAESDLVIVDGAEA